MVFYQPVERTTKQSDCALVSIVKEGGVPTAQLSRSWSLPVDVQSLLDLAFAKTSVGNGIFVLYKDVSLLHCRERRHLLADSFLRVLHNRS